MKRVEGSVHDTEKALYEQQIEQYISTYLAQGYSPKQLEEYLLEKGYHAASIKKALKKINRTKYKGDLEVHTSKNSLHLILIVGFIILILAAGIYVYSQSEGPYKFLVTIKNQDLSQGESLEFLIGTTRNVEVHMRLYDEDSRLLLQQNEFFETSQSYMMNIPRGTQAGNYRIEFDVTYKGKTNQQSFSFTIREEDTSQAPAEFQDTPTILVPLEDSSLEEFSKAIQSKDARGCETIDDDELVEECYFVIARDTQNEMICASISTPYKKDNCYLTQLLAGKNIVCDTFETANGRNTCIQLS